MRSALVILMVLSACGGGKFAASPPPAGMVYKDMNHQQRMYLMEHEVLPQMKAAFAAFDPKYKDMNCNTCHGDGSHDGTFKMPNPKLPVLPGTEESYMAWIAKDADAARYTKFMAETVTPKMAAMLHLEPFDPKTKTGDFSCGRCHTMKK